MRPGVFLFPAMLVASFSLAAEKQVETLRCRLLAIGKAPAGDVYVKSKGKYQKIVISTDYVTASCPLETKDGIRLFRKKNTVDPENQKNRVQYESFCGCAPAGNAKRQLVVIAPGPGDTWLAGAKADMDTDFPHGTRLVFNLTGTTVGFNFGGTKLMVPPGQSGLLNAAKSAPDGIAPVKMLRQTASGEWVMFGTGIWRQSHDERLLLLVRPVAGSEDPAISAIQDRVEHKAADESPPESARP